MSVVTITIANSISVAVEKDDIVSYKPRNMVPVINGTSILFQNPSNVNYDFYLDASDTITAEGNPVTGTAQEIADTLVSTVFFEPASGGGVTNPLTVENTDATGSASMSLVCGTNEISINTYGPDHATYPNEGHISASSPIQVTCFMDYIALNTQQGVDLYNADATSDGYLGIGAGGTYFTISTYGGSSSGNPTLAGKTIIECGGEIRIRINNANELIIPAGGIDDYADDSAAATGSVPVRGLYHTSGTLKIRLS